MRAVLIAGLALVLCACGGGTRGEETVFDDRVSVPMSFDDFVKAIKKEDLKQVQAGISAHPQWVRQSNEFLTTPLHNAVSHSTDPEITKVLLKNGADVNAKNKGGLSPLHCAILEGNSVEVLSELIKAKADVNDKVKGGGTPLHMAVFSQSPETIRLLLRARADVMAKNSEGESVLAYAVSLGKKEGSEMALQAFVDAGVDVNFPSITGDPLLHYAISQKFSHLIPILIAGGADLTSKDLNGRVPLQLAREIGDREIIELLQEVQNKNSQPK